MIRLGSPNLVISSDVFASLNSTHIAWAYVVTFFCLKVELLRHLYVPDEGSLLPKYRDCTTSNDFELDIELDIYNI